MKPEDVIITDDVRENWAHAEVAAITPQVGSFKVTIDFEGLQIIALTNDEELVKRLRAKSDRSISFSFNSESVFIFS
jgi:hypothetical protein